MKRFIALGLFSLFEITSVYSFNLPLVVYNQFDDWVIPQIGIWNNATTTYGWQIGIVNISNNEIFGTQLGVVNISSTLAGFSLGVVNYSEDMSGVQFGIYNYADWGIGIQIGLVNYSSRFTGFKIGSVNVDDTIYAIGVLFCFSR
ncbi:hypothetical protein FACS1894190_04280 [Spirochaetia bacterium]|nr:hypothetical protein FACS1894190_04280 [Spirochaetia bacterium]